MKILQKGERIKLSDYVDPTKELVVALKTTGSKINCCCLGLDDAGNAAFLVDKDKTKAPFNTVVLTPQTETFSLSLEHLPQPVLCLVFIIDKNSEFHAASVKIIEKDSTLFSFNFTDNIFNHSQYATILEIYRKDNVWRLRVVAEKTQEILKKHLRKSEPIKPLQISVLTPSLKLSNPSNALVQPVSPPIARIQSVSSPITRTPVKSPPVVQVGQTEEEDDEEELRGFDKLFAFLLGEDSKCITSIAKIDCIRHFFWTLWFWFPFGAVLGWLHLAMKTHRFAFLRYALQYGNACIILFFLSSFYWGLMVVVPWIIGIIHCYSTFKTTFLQTLDSCGRRGFSHEDVKGEKHNLNTISYETFINTSVPNKWAIPILFDRYKHGFYGNLPTFCSRLKIAQKNYPFVEKYFYVEPITTEHSERSKRKRKRRLIFGGASLLLLIAAVCYGMYAILEQSPDLKLRCYTALDWDYYKAAQGLGSGVSKNEALHNAKVNALANALGEDLFHKEIGTIDSATHSTDVEDKTTVTQDEKENYTKQVQGRVSDVEIIEESQSPDGLFNITIRAKILMNANRK
jgi:stress response protein SCP2